MTYQFEGTSTDNVLQRGTNKCTFVSGTEMMMGAKGSGTCTATGNPDGSANLECTGRYTLAR